MAEIKGTKEVVGDKLPITYQQNTLQLHEGMATGEVDGVKFVVDHSWTRVYVSFPGKLKGEIPNIGIDVIDLVKVALEIARGRKLLE